MFRMVKNPRKKLKKSQLLDILDQSGDDQLESADSNNSQSETCIADDNQSEQSNDSTEAIVESDDETDDSSDEEPDDKQPKLISPVDYFKATVEATVESDASSDEGPEIIEFVCPIKAAKERRLKRKNGETDVTAPMSKRKTIEMESISKKQIRKDIEQVKFSVQQFGLQAYNPEEKRKLERQRLIRLGAKAPKPEWKNYKGNFNLFHLNLYSKFIIALMQEKKDQNITQAEQAAADPAVGFLKSASLTKPKGAGKKGFWTDNTKNTNRQQIGSWKGGQLSISKSKFNKMLK